MHWRNSYKPCHCHSLSKKQKEQILESHIFIEQKRDGTIKARKVIGGNKQRDYITKEDVSSPTVTAEAVMLTCVIDAQAAASFVEADPNIWGVRWHSLTHIGDWLSSESRPLAKGVSRQ